MTAMLPVEHWHYGLIEVLLGLRAVLAPKIANGTFQIYGLGDCIPTRSARAALVAAIRSLELRPGAQIGVPLYCCPVVFKAIQAAGCRPCFIDVEPSTYCLSAEDLNAKRAAIDAVIAVHMFGNMCDMPSLQAAAQGKPVIEDCAQSLGSKFGERVAGSFGIMSAFSFRSGKYLSVGEGGAVFSSDTNLHSRLSQFVAATPAPGFYDECVHLATTYIRSKLRSRPFYGVLGVPLWNLYNKKVHFTEKSPIVLGQIYTSDWVIAKRRLARLESFIEAQRVNADLYSRALKLPDRMLCWERPGTYYNRYLYPITFPDSEQRDYLASYLQSREISTSAPYKDIAEVASSHYGYSGDCPMAEKIARTVLVIPSHHGLGISDIQHIAGCVNQGWDKIVNRGGRSQSSL